MKKEKEALEEKRRQIAKRREEYEKEFKEWEEALDTVSGHLRKMNSARTRRVTEVQFCCMTHSFSSLASLVLHFYMKPAHVDITNCMAH